MTDTSNAEPEWVVLAEFYSVKDALEVCEDLLEQDVRACLVRGGQSGENAEGAEPQFMATVLVPEDEVELAQDLLDSLGVDFQEDDAEEDEAQEDEEAGDMPADSDMVREDESAWVAVTEFTSLSDADLICGCLRSEGIPAWITDEHAYFADRGFPKSQVMVPSHRAEEAVRLVEDARTGKLKLESEDGDA